MKKLIFGVVMFVTACGSLPPPLCLGTREYDVQVCRGEKHRVGVNFPFEAQQRARKCDQCIDIEDNCYHGIPPQCRPNWRFEQ